MHRTDAADYIVTSGKRQYKESPEPATVFGFHQANAIQEEICTVIEAAGVTLRASGGADATAGYGGQLNEAIDTKVAVVGGALTSVSDQVDLHTDQINEIDDRLIDAVSSLGVDLGKIYGLWCRTLGATIVGGLLWQAVTVTTGKCIGKDAYGNVRRIIHSVSGLTISVIEGGDWSALVYNGGVSLTNAKNVSMFACLDPNGALRFRCDTDHTGFNIAVAEPTWFIRRLETITLFNDVEIAAPASLRRMSYIARGSNDFVSCQELALENTDAEADLGDTYCSSRVSTFGGTRYITYGDVRYGESPDPGINNWRNFMVVPHWWSPVPGVKTRFIAFGVCDNNNKDLQFSIAYTEPTLNGMDSTFVSSQDGWVPIPNSAGGYMTPWDLEGNPDTGLRYMKRNNNNGTNRFAMAVLGWVDSRDEVY